MAILGVWPADLCLMLGENLHIPKFLTWLWMSQVDTEKLEKV